jgi:signal transduction histidine kinase
MQAHPDMLVPSESDPAHNVVLARIYEEVQSAAELTRELGVLSRREDDHAPFQVIDVRTVVEACAVTLRPMLRKTIRLAVQLPANPLPVLGHAGKLKQIIINLVINARDTLAEGGEILVEAQLRELCEADVAGRSGQPAGQYVCLVVRDTGHGMDEETQRRVFEPFFTTKEPGRGTGLGLSMVKSLVERHQGWVELESTLNVGTTFRIYLPQAVDRAGVAERI